MIFVTLPAYNEEKTLGPLCRTLKNVFQEYRINYRILVVNDGSHDDTEEVALGLKKIMPLGLINHKKNMGLNEAIKTGLLQALKEAGPDDIIITMDADNTHTPGLILRMIRMIREGNDVVIASRFLSDSRIRGVSAVRSFISLCGSILFKIFFPIKGVRDYTCGYRAYKVSVLRKAFSYYGNDFINQQGFSVTVDILLKLRNLDIIVTEAPLVLRYDFKYGTSKMKVLRTIKESLVLIAKRRLEPLREN